jgi:hypothetical protein
MNPSPHFPKENLNQPKRKTRCDARFLSDVDKKKRKAELDSIRHKRKKEAEREDPLYA